MIREPITCALASFHHRQNRHHHSPPGVQGGASGRNGAAKRERALSIGARAARRGSPARVRGRVRGLRDLEPHGPLASRAATHTSPSCAAIAS